MKGRLNHPPSPPKKLPSKSPALFGLILTPFSPFDITCKKLNLMQTTYENVFLGHLEKLVFHIFPKLDLIMGGSPNTF